MPDPTHAATSPPYRLTSISCLLILALIGLARPADAGVPFLKRTVEGDSFASVGKNASIAVNDQGAAHFAYGLTQGAHVRYKSVFNRPAIIYTISNSAGFGGMELALNEEGLPTISFVRTSTFSEVTAHVIRSQSTTCCLSSYYSGPERTFYPSVRVDAGDAVHLAFAFQQDTGFPRELRYGNDRVVTLNPSQVAGETIASVGGAAIALDLGAGGNARIAYRHETEGLKYAELFPGAGGWQFDDVPGADDAEHIALFVDSSDSPHIVFHDPSETAIKYATRPGAVAWTVETVDDGSITGTYGSIALDSQGTPHVSYYRESSKDLLYGVRNGPASWTTMEIEWEPEIGKYSSIAIDRYDEIHIAYYDETNERLRYAYSDDCNNNGSSDHLESFGSGSDCNDNGVLDECEIDAGFLEDCNDNNIPDYCDDVPDCDNNGIPDECGGYQDCNLNSIPDVCEEDCNGNGRPDDCDIDLGLYLDCNDNGVLDVCEPPFLWEPVFSETHLTNFPDVRESDTDWGDWDADGDLDPLVIGTTNTTPAVQSRVYLHEPWGFFEISAPLWHMSNGSADWADWDGDGDLDFSLAGRVGTIEYFQIYRNNDGLFLLHDGLPAHDLTPSVTWADADNDGDLDVLYMAGFTTDTMTRLYRNDDDTFVNIGDAGLPALGFPSIVWGDYDADGDQDVLACGQQGSSIYGRETSIYRNDGGVFAEHEVGLEDVAGKADWADYDADGDLDIIVYGGTGFLSSDALIYRNDGGTFVDLGVDLGFIPDETSFGDYDNDGDLDILYTGRPHPTPPFVYSRVLRNDDGTFVDVDLGLRALQDVDISWSDYDSDGDLDIALSGATTVSAVSELYDSDCSLKNTPPTAPTNLALSIDGTSYTFSWDPATDAETPAPGLTYNLRVGTSPGASDIMSAMSDHVTGYRQVPRMGNMTHTRSWTLDIPGPEPIFWGVQAIDGGFAGSPFATAATQPVCRVEPRSIAFGHVSGHADSSFTITNAGGGQLTGDVTSTCGDFIVLTGGGPFSLGPLESLEVDVRFTPLSVGAHACAIDLGVAECATRAYLGDLEGGMKILDVTDPASPQLVSTMPEPTLEMQIVDGVAYLTGDTSTGAFRVAGVFDPAQPYDISSLDVPSFSRDVKVVGTIAYVATSSTGKMHVIDVETPAAPVLLGTFNSADQVWRLDVDGEWAYLASETEGLQVVEADDLDDAFPDRFGQYLTPAPAWGVDVVGNVAFVASSDAGLQILDVTTPDPVFIASLAIPGRCDDVHIEGDYAYVAAGDSGLAIVDVSDPMLPALVSRHLTPDWLASVDVFAGHAYLATTEAGLEIVDVRDPANPVSVGTFDTDGDSRGIQVVGGVELTGVGDAVVAVPEALPPELALRPGRPNPFGAATTIRWSLDRTTDVKVTIYDVTGRRVRQLVDGRLGIGEHAVTWDGRDEAGRNAPDGTYFLQLRDGSRVLTRKIVRVR